MDRRKILLVIAVVVAALGAGLVFVYAQGAEDRAADKQDARSVLVATQDILPGESAADAANAGKLLSQRVPSDQVLTGSTNDGADFTDSIALTTIYAGEQLLTQKFGTIDEIEGKPTLPIPQGKTAITLKLTDTGRVSSFTQPGSHVAVYFAPDPSQMQTGGQTGNPGVVQVLPACVIEDDLLVLGVGTVSVDQQPVGEGQADPEEDSGDTIALMTVAVDSAQASTLVGFQIAAEREGKTLLAFALRNDASEVRNTRVCADYLESLGDLLGPGRSNADDDVNG